MEHGMEFLAVTIGFLIHGFLCDGGIHREILIQTKGCKYIHIEFGFRIGKVVLNSLILLSERCKSHCVRGNAHSFCVDRIQILHIGDLVFHPRCLLRLIGDLLVFVHNISSCQRMTICVAMRSASAFPFRASMSARPKGMAQPAEVPVISLPSVTQGTSGIMRASAMPSSQPG